MPEINPHMVLSHLMMKKQNAVNKSINAPFVSRTFFRALVSATPERESVFETVRDNPPMMLMHWTSTNRNEIDFPKL